MKPSLTQNEQTEMIKFYKYLFSNATLSSMAKTKWWNFLGENI